MDFQSESSIFFAFVLLDEAPPLAGLCSLCLKKKSHNHCHTKCRKHLKGLENKWFELSCR